MRSLLSHSISPLFLLALVLLSPGASAQIINVTNQTSTPIPGAGHDYIKMLNETVNPANGSVSLRIQVPTPPGRQLSLPFAFAYDSSGAQHIDDWSGLLSWMDNTGYLSQGGWSYSVPMVTSLLVSESAGRGRCNYRNNFVFQDETGGRHSLYLAIDLTTPQNCSTASPIVPTQVFSGGDDLYQAALTTSTAPLLIASAHGKVYSMPIAAHNVIDNAYASLPVSIEDSNGNMINVRDNGNGSFAVTDTVGRTMLSSSGFGSSGDTISASSLPNHYTVAWGANSANHSVGGSLIRTDGSCATTLPPLNGPASVVKQITLPNNTSYVFSYDSSYGLLDKIMYPDGGYVSYTWTMNALSEFESFEDENGIPNECFWQHDVPALLQRSVSFDGVHIAHQQNFSYSTTWASGGTAWTSKTTTITTTDNVSGLSYTAVYTYSPYSARRQPNDNSEFQPQLPLEQSVVTKNSAGTVMRTVNKTWFDQFELKSQQTVLENNLTSETDYTYGAGAQVTEQDDYDFGSGARGGLLRKAVNTYQTFSAIPIFPSTTSIFDHPCQSIVYDGAGNRLAESDYLYDGGTSVCGTAGTPSVSNVSNLPTGTHDETNYGATSTAARGNLTKTIKQCFQGSQACASGNLATTSTYDETGQITSTTDPNNHTTQYTYSDSYTVLSGGANVAHTPSSNTNAYLTKITNPLSQTQNFTYDFNNGQLTIARDANSLTTTYLYNDPLARPTLTTRPDNGTTTVAYNDTALTVTTSKKINSGQTLTSVALSDGVGHVKQTQRTSDPQGTVYADTSYDGLGRVYTVSNPYRTGSDPTTSSGTTTYYYDALGRKCLEVPPDGTQPSGSVCPTTQPANTIFTIYSGNTTKVTDQTGKSRKSVTDGLGRMTQVLEDPSGVNYETDYAYDALGNLLCVGQKGTNSGTFTNCSSIPTGWHPRTFSYDSMSRLLTSTNAETGTITYKYDSDSNCASPSTFIGLLISKTDARGIRTCAQYDAINRENVLNYSNGDPTITTVYDGSNCLGLSACQNIGQRTGVTDAAGSESRAYQVDTANNRSIHVNQRTTNSITKTSTYYLDLAGNLTQVAYPTGRVVNYSYDNADRPSTAIDGSNGVTYATDFQSAPTGCLSGAVCYTPQGTFYALSIGQATGFTGLNLTHTYNNRLQPNEFKASSSGGNAIDITYNFVDPVTGHNAGHVYAITNNLDATRSQTFTYDSLNRISSALTTSTYATSPAHCWGENYTVDAWGNLNGIAATTNSNYTGCSQESGFSSIADGNNHLPAWAYDASGNATSDGFVTNYVWNAESQLKSAAGVTYNYDGDGRRVSKSNGTLYWYGSGGDILAETDNSGKITAEYVFLGGKRVARLTAGTPGKGSATISGSEQSISGAGATSGTGSVTFSGTLQSKQVQTQAAAPGSGPVTINGTLQSQQTAAKAGTGSVTFSAPGSIQTYTFDPCQGNLPPAPGSCPQTVSNTGTITFTVAGQQFTINYTGVASQDATAMQTAINQGSSYVTAPSVTGSTTNLTAKTTGTGSNYAMSCCTYTWNQGSFNGTPFFSGPNDTASSGSSLTGGTNASTAYDSGSCTIVVNNSPSGDSTSWSGSGTTSSSIASGLASSINGNSSALVSASAPSGSSTVTLTAKTSGATTNYSLSSSCSSSMGSFTTSNGSALTNGRDASYTTVYDSGTSTITVKGHPDSFSWSGSATTTFSIASALISKINADSAAFVTAGSTPVCSGNACTINLTATTTGASTNYTLSSSSTYDSSNFSSASFSSNSGTTLTGGNDAGATTYDTGTVWVTINTTQYPVSYGQGSSPSSIASALASAISAGTLANATATGSGISITAKGGGAGTNYSLSAGTSTSQPGSFPSGSFTAATGGSSLSGGTDGVSYYVEDMLGTSRVVTTDTGVVCYDADFYPYGGERSYTNTCPQNYKFEGKERDTETGNDDFGARSYSNRFARWLSADWSDTPTAVPYAALANPQSLNLYSFVGNDPLTHGDLDGHCWPLCDVVTWAIGRAAADGGPKQFAKNVGIGAAKGVGSFAYNTAKTVGTAFSSMGNPAAAAVAAMKPAPAILQPSNTTQAQVSATTQITLTAATVLAPAVAPEAGLADSALVVRGGVATPAQLTKGAESIAADGTLSGVSVQSANGATVEELSQAGGFRNNQISVTTVGDVRAVGGDVVPTPEKGGPCHCDMNGVQAEDASRLFKTQPNPSKVKVDQQQ